MKLNNYKLWFELHLFIHTSTWFSFFKTFPIYGCHVPDTHGSFEENKGRGKEKRRKKM